MCRYNNKVQKIGGKEKAKHNLFLQNYIEDVGNLGEVMCASNQKKCHFHSAYL